MVVKKIEFSKIKSRNSYYGLSLIFILFLIAQIPYLHYNPYYYISDMIIEAPSTVKVGEEFIISGTSRIVAAERVELYVIDNEEPIGYTVVGVEPPYVYEFEVLVSNDSLTINGIVYDSGPIAGKSLHFYVRSFNNPYMFSPTASITIET